MGTSIPELCIEIGGILIVILAKGKRIACFIYAWILANTHSKTLTHVIILDYFLKSIIASSTPYPIHLHRIYRLLSWLASLVAQHLLCHFDSS